MQRKRETRPAAGKHSGRAYKSNHIVSQNSEAFWNALCIGLVLFMFLVAPRLMYMYLAPLKGWC